MFERAVAEMIALDDARRARKAAKARARREAKRHQERVDLWIERGYGRRPSLERPSLDVTPGDLGIGS